MESDKDATGVERHSIKAVIRNAAGIHCRPTALIVKEARRYPGAKIILSNGRTECDPVSAINVLSMGLDKGAEVEIRVEGPDAVECGERLARLFETEFDFPPRDKDA